VSSRNALENSTANSWLQQSWCPSVSIRQEYYTGEGKEAISIKNVELSKKKSGSIFDEWVDLTEHMT